MLHSQLGCNGAAERVAEKRKPAGRDPESVAGEKVCSFCVEPDSFISRPALDSHITTILRKHHGKTGSRLDLLRPVEPSNGEIGISVEGNDEP